MLKEPNAISRRTMLRGAGVGLALPLLDAMTPARRPRAVGRRAAPHVRHLQQPRPAAR